MTGLVFVRGRHGTIISDQAKFYGVTIPDGYVVVRFEDKVRDGGTYLGEMVRIEECKQHDATTAT